GQSATATVSVIVISPSVGGSLQSGQICVPVSKIVFNTAPVNGTCGFATFSLINAGAGQLRIASVSLAEGTNFRLEAPANLPMALQSAGVIQLKIMFQPKSAGTLN